MQSYLFAGSRRSHLVVFLGVLTALNIFIFHTLQKPAELTVSFLNVGDGEAVLVQTPSGGIVLIGGGPDAGILRELGTTLPFWERRIDAVIQTDSARSAIGGLAHVLERYQISSFVKPGEEGDTATAAALTAAVSARPDTKIVVAHQGTRLHFGGGVYIEVLYQDPQSVEGDSLVLKLVYGATSFLISGDILSSARARLTAHYEKSGYLKSDVLFVPHQGKKGSIDEKWLHIVKPNVAVMSVGEDNRYDYPEQETISLLENEGVEVFRTDRDGRVTLVSDGASVRLK